ncbi:MAG: peptidase [Bacteroidetes bacterium SW_9_63_38]|nr:MAG: peptidase [Bacteroidetes bacterium SW_9_63_38]
MKRILFLFLDGLGIGPPTESNPFARTEYPAFRRLAFNQSWHAPFTEHVASRHVVRSLDATLGIDGLPQSGTGQGTLFTGINCANLVGRHFGPFPHSKTHAVLDEQNVFQQLRTFPCPKTPVAFANAFPPPFFDASRRRSTVTTHCCLASNVPLRNRSALVGRRAVSADLTNAYWRTQLDLDVPERTVTDAASVLASVTKDHAFTLFEYFLTDKVGHGRVDLSPTTLLSELDRFVETLLDQLDPSTDTVALTSDHGNLEDTAHTRHTRNPVPLLVYGWAAPFFANATDLMDVTPAIVDALRSTRI